MNTIKKLIRYALYIVLVYSAISCTDVEMKTEETNYATEQKIKRIKLVEQTNINGYIFYIVEVDGKEFFVNGRGGVQPLSNCN